MGKRLISESFEKLGSFWTKEDPKSLLAGTLSSDKGKLYLQKAPAARAMDENAMREAFSCFE
jgi:hypothetical protein